LLIELDDHDRAAGELDAERHALGLDDAHAGNDDQPRQADGEPSPAEEIEIGVLKICMVQPRY
jgi:hypothetical protein